MIPISVFIITKNEEERIAPIINAAKEIADEILVIDSGSTDKTCDIAAKLGAKVMFNAWNGYGAQKIFGENQCRNNWILNIDADEEVSEELALEIENLFLKQNPDQFSGYKIKILNKFFNEKKPKKLAYYYNQLRLYNKEFCGFKDSTVHDSVILKTSDNYGQNSIGQLKNIISHQSFRSINHWLEKINSYSEMQAKDSFRKNRKPSILKILITPFFAFFKGYFIRRYFIYGFDGLVYSYIFAFGRTIKLVKTRELFKDNH